MKTLKYIALAALTLSFAACEKDNDFQGISDPDAVKINATIGALQTRVSYSGTNGETSFANGDAIKVVNTKRTSKNEASYTTTDGTNWTTSDAMVWNSSSFNQFQAWYPVADYSSFESFTIPEDQSDAAKLAAADWMTAETEDIDKPENCVLNLNFQHRLTKVTVTVTQFTSQYASDATLSEATIYSLTADNITVENGNNGITPYQEDKSVTAIICPGKYNADATLIEITVTDANGNYTLTVPVNDYLVNTGLAAGSHYTFSLKVGKETVKIADVNVTPWTEQTIDGVDTEECQHETWENNKCTDCGATIEITGMKYVGDEAVYDAETNTYTILISPDTPKTQSLMLKLLARIWNFMRINILMIPC